METILTVLITLGVVAFIVTVWGVIRLSRRVDDLELIRMELVDFEGRFERQIEQEQQDRQALGDDTYKRFDEWNASIDRRHDKLWTEWHNLDDKVKQLDNTVNPNMDLLK